MYLTEPYTEILGGKDVFIDQHSALNLTCVIHAPEPPAHIFWIHDDHVSIEIRIPTYIVLGTPIRTKDLQCQIVRARNFWVWADLVPELTCIPRGKSTTISMALVAVARWAPLYNIFLKGENCPHSNPDIRAVTLFLYQLSLKIALTF